MRRALLFLSLVWAIGACAAQEQPDPNTNTTGVDSAASEPSAASIRSIISTSYNYSASPTQGYDPSILTLKTVDIAFTTNRTFPSSSVNATDNTTLVVGVRVEENRVLQKMIGVGCGVTDASSVVLQGVKEEAPDVYEEIMRLLWSRSGEDAEDGIGAALTQVRSPLGASDFGITEYTYDSTADCSPDTNFTLFNINQAPKMWATHLDILNINPNVHSWFLPWTAPPWMKEPCGYRKGALKEENEDLYAEYLARSMRDIAKKLGKNPSRIGIQESPDNTPDAYPGMEIDASQAARVANALRKKLDAQDQRHLGITALEASWNKVDYAIQTFDEADADTYSGVAFHCYAGDAEEAQRDFQAKYPNKPIYQTSCTRVSQGYEEFWLNLRKNAMEMLFGSVGAGAVNLMVWNCVLQADDDGFTMPNLPDTCPNCLSPVFVTRPTNTSVLSQQINSTSPSGGQNGSTTFKLTSDYAILAHVSRAIRNPHDDGFGHVIGVENTEKPANFKSEEGARVFSLAFRSVLPSGKWRYSLIVLQKNDYHLTGRYEPVELVVGFRNQTAVLDLKEPGLYTVVWEADAL